MSARDDLTLRLADRARRFPDLDVEPIAAAGLPPRDAALVRAIDHIVARRWLTLSAVIDAALTQPWAGLHPNVQAPLLAGATQLLFMERVPDHAVVSEAVAWTKRHSRAKAGGLVNAVLRRIAGLRGEVVDRAPQPPMPRDLVPMHDGRALRLREPVFDDDPLIRLAQQSSHPAGLLRRWMAALGERTTAELALHNLVHPPITVTGIDPARHEPALLPHEEPGFFVFTGERGELDALLARHPVSRVQDPATAHALASMAHAIESPDLIIDLCAGRGTKARQLAGLWPQARIVATDVSESRLTVLREVFESRAENRVETIEFAGIRRFDERADVLVIDAPCSNSGVLARRMEAKYRLTPSYLEQVAQLQRQILADAIPLLAPSGKLLYITCSIEREENEAQAAWLGRWHGLKIVRQTRRVPRGLPGESPARYADGGYAALLVLA